MHRQRDVLPLRARRVDDDVAHPVLLQEAQRLLAVLVLVPAPVPELDEHLVVLDLLARPGEVVEGGFLRDDVRRELEQETAELPSRAKRLERRPEPPEDLGAKLTRRPVDPAAIVLRRLVAQVRRQLLDLHGMPGHDAERLDVHDEAVGRALGPALDHLLDGQPVVGRVHLDRVEVLGVEAEPRAGRHPLWVPVLRERLVGPRAGADSDRRGHAARIRERGPAAEPRSRAFD